MESNTDMRYRGTRIIENDLELNKPTEDGFANDMICKLPKKQSTKELIFESCFEFIVITSVLFTFGHVLRKIFDFDQMYLFYLVGLLVSIKATHYKYKIWKDPSFKSKYCNCTNNDSFQQTKLKGILKVLDHKKGSIIFNIPNSVFGVILYTLLLTLYSMNLTSYLITSISIISFLASLYLWLIMVFDVKTICILCMTIHSVNFLTFLYLIIGYIGLFE